MEASSNTFDSTANHRPEFVRETCCTFCWYCRTSFTTSYGTFNISSGGVANITITDAGTGYTTSAHTFSFTNARATGAFATATLGTGASATAVIDLGATAPVSGIYTNGKRMRFASNNSLNDSKLSQNACCVVETCNIPSITNLAAKYLLLRLVTSTQDKACDTKRLESPRLSLLNR